jgi:hypothetical protein
MRRYYPRIHPRQINRALAEMGLQHHSIVGWELSALGRTLGGQQEESENTGAFYVTWPHEIVDHPVVHRELTRQTDQNEPSASPASSSEPDLFANATRSLEEFNGIDGHSLNGRLERRVCNWLYLAQLAHAYRRALPTEEVALADFYLPAGNVYIDCWEADVPANELSAKLHKRDIYKELGLRSIEVNAVDAEKLDEVLGRGLLAFGIRC